MKRALLGTVLLAFCMVPLFAEDLSGHWSLVTNVAGRDVTLQMTIRQEGDSLRGKVAGPRREYPIQRGSVDSANNVNILLGGKGPLAGATFTGTLNGDRLRLTVHTKSGEAEGEAVRSQ